jgi:hypothetical protein
MLLWVVVVLLTTLLPTYHIYDALMFGCFFVYRAAKRQASKHWQALEAKGKQQRFVTWSNPDRFEQVFPISSSISIQNAQLL